MNDQARASSYGPLAITLHWVMAIAIPVVFALGMYMKDLPLSPDKLQYYSWHKWAGVSLFLFAAGRLAVRFFSVHPGGHAAAVEASWQSVAAEWSHRLLYMLMFAVPLSGWVMSSAKGVTTVYFGIWTLPNLIERNTALGVQLQYLHISCNYLMAFLIFIHISAAIKHHFLDKDEVLIRMLPFAKKRSCKTSL